MARNEYNWQTKKLNNKIQDLKDHLTKIVDSDSQIVLCWGGGKDSTLLLHILRELEIDFSILIFPHLFSKKQKQFIAEMVEKYRLIVFFYSPESVHISPDGKHFTSFYQIGDKVFRLITDYEKIDDFCGLELVQNIEKHVRPVFMWTDVIFGSKATDTHVLADSVDFRLDSTENTSYHCPLWDWNDDEILFAIRELKLDYNVRVYDDADESYNSGTMTGCFECQLTDDQVYCLKTGTQIQGIKKNA